jgi:tetratricopeptide (TPR) repeat protein
VVGNLVRLGDVRRSAGDPIGAKSYFVQANELAGKALDRHPENIELSRALATTLNRLAGLAMSEGKLDDALTYTNQWTQRAFELLSLDPNNVEYQYDNALALAQIARIHSERGDFEIAEDFAARQAERYRQIALDDPSSALAQSRLATAEHIQGEILNAGGQLEEAKRAWTSAAEIHRKLFEQNPSNTRFALLGSESMLRAGLSDLSAGKIKQGLNGLHSGLDLMTQGVPDPEQNQLLAQQLKSVETMITTFDSAYQLTKQDLSEILQADPPTAAISAYFSAKSGEIDRALDIAKSFTDFLDDDAESRFYVHSMLAAVFAEALNQPDLPKDQSFDNFEFTKSQLQQLAITALKKTLEANPQWIQMMRKSPDYIPLRSLPEFQELITPE